MTQEFQTLLTIAVPTLAVLMGILINNARLNDVSARIDRVDQHIDRMDLRIDKLDAGLDRRHEDLKQMWRAELRRVEEVLDARLSHIEERMG